MMEPNSLKNLDDEKFIEAIYYNCYGFMRHKILQVTKDEATLPDLIQETILRLIPKIPLLRTLTEVQVAAYAGNTAMHLALDYVREKNPILAEWQVDNLTYKEENTPEQVYERKESMEEWSSVLNCLTEFEKRFLILHYQLELTPKQICKSLGFPIRLFDSVFQEITDKVYGLYRGEGNEK